MYKQILYFPFAEFNEIFRELQQAQTMLTQPGKYRTLLTLGLGLGLGLEYDSISLTSGLGFGF